MSAILPITCMRVIDIHSRYSINRIRGKTNNSGNVNINILCQKTFSVFILKDM